MYANATTPTLSSFRSISASMNEETYRLFGHCLNSYVDRQKMGAVLDRVRERVFFFLVCQEDGKSIDQ